MEKRTFQIEVGSIRDADQRTVEATLSTTYPVRRYDGEEVLSHDPDAIDLSRAPLPLINSHDARSLPVGIVESLQVVGGKLRGLLRISKSQDRIWGDIQDGILRNLSIGYFIKEKKRTAKGYLVTKWQPYECSLVAAGADPAAGIGRSIFTTIRKGNATMDLNDILKAKKRAVDELTEMAMTENLDEAATARFDELKGEIRTLDSRIEAIEMAKAGKEDLAKRSGTFKPELEKKQDRTIQFEGGPAADRSYRGMFGELQRDDSELEKFKRAMIEGVGSAGGFSVPDPLAAQWLDESLQNEIIRPRATVWPMTSSSRTVPGWDGKDQSAGLLYGGFAMEFLAENAEATPQNGKLRSIVLQAHKGAIFCDISNELREDGQGFESQLEMAMKKSISLGLDYYFMQGSGAGQPQGILNSPALVTVEKETSQGADTIIFANVGNMFARMYPAGRSKAVWLANETTIPQLLSMYVPIGDSNGEAVPVFKETSGGFSLLGRPVIFTPDLPVLGDAGDLVFVDLSQYAIGLRKDLRLEKSNIPGWSADLMSYRVIVRVDGMGTWNTYISPRNGDPLSWCVTLAERAEG